MTQALGMCGFTIGRASYFKQFNVVEVQQTFYDPPALETLARWRAEAPPDFQFAMKAWQVITHLGTSPTYRRLVSPFSESERDEAGGFRLTKTVLRAWEKTLECARTLRATAILFQCPASFRPTDENIDALRAFFETIERPPETMLAWEPRGPWPAETIADVCWELGLIDAVDPFVRSSTTPDMLYWRLHGNKSHYARYTDDELRELYNWLLLAGNVDAYVLFNNIPRVKDVRRFRELADEIGVAQL
jgi:uncharacterized protein YecE (DUF72 family)